LRFSDSTPFATVLALAFAVACGATHRVEDAPEPLDVDASTGGSGGESSSEEADNSEPLIVGEPEALPSDSPSSEDTAGASPTSPVAEPETSGAADAGVIPVPSLPLEDVPVPSFEAVTLPADTNYPTVGILVDDRSVAAPPLAPSIATDCALIQALTAERQRTTAAMGVQFSVGLLGPGGLPLPASSFAECLELSDLEGVVLPAAKSGAAATGALTLLLLQPGQTAEEQALLQDAALKLFMSRPQGERMALYRWGASVDQVVGFTNFRDMYGEGLKDRVPLLEGEAMDVNVALSSAVAALSAVADDSFPWTRSVVVLAPQMLATEIVPVARNAHVLFAVNAEGTEAFNLVHTAAASPSEAMGQVSARLNAARGAGFVTYGVCGSGAVQPVRVRSLLGAAQLELELKAALPEEVTEAACDPEQVAAFQFIDTNLIELQFTAAEREIYDEVLQDRDDSVDFALNARLAAGYGLTPALAHLRGGTSLMECPDDRTNYSIDLSGGRERFFYPDGSGSVGSDEFYLTAMCLDPMYINQLSIDRLMAPLGVFVSGVKMVEVRLDGQTQGVYLLMEQVKEALVRSQSGLRSVIRRRDGSSEVKFPGDTDVAGQELALADFDNLVDSLQGLTGVERLAAMRPRIDLYRYMNFVALQSIIHNADWGDEPTQYAVNSLGAAGPIPFFSINGWDPDDVLLDGCAHDDVLRDPFELIGCAEFSFEKAFFGNGSPNSNSVVDDEVYALYVDTLENALGYFTEERVGAAFEQTAAELVNFSVDPAIVEVMPDFRNQDDVAAAIDAAVLARKEAFAARRAFLVDQLAVYRGR
jgi:hypothetical protein